MSSANAWSDRAPYCFATSDARWPIRHRPVSAAARAARPSATSRPQFGPREEARPGARLAGGECFPVDRTDTALVAMATRLRGVGELTCASDCHAPGGVRSKEPSDLR